MILLERVAAGQLDHEPLLIRGEATEDASTIAASVNSASGR